jgi:hypothetical protein
VPQSDLIQRYLPLSSFHGELTVAPRKLLAFVIGDSTVVRSSNPKGYLIPDVGAFVPINVGEGTVRPESTTISLEDAGIVIRISTTAEAADELLRVLSPTRVNSLVVTHPDEDHVMFLGGVSAPSSFPPSPMTHELAIGSAVVDLVEDAPGLVDKPKPELPGVAEQHRPEIRADATVAEIATQLAAISSLTDGELASLFRVARETFQRWRTGELMNPHAANRRRLWLLLRLFQDLAERDVKVHDWLVNVSEIDDLTPYELLERGRIDDVEHLASQLAPPSEPSLERGGDGGAVTRATGLPAFARRQDEPKDDLTLDDHEDWSELEVEIVEDGD